MSIRRVLIIGSSHVSALERHYQRAFQSLGIDAVLYDAEELPSLVTRSRVLRRAANSVLHHITARRLRSHFSGASRYDLVFVVKGYGISPDTIAECRRLTSGIRWVLLNPDNPFDSQPGASNEFIRQSLPLFDLYLIWSRDLVHRIQASGAPRVRHLRFGFDEANHFPAETRDPSLAGVVTFVGSYDQYRAAALEPIADLPVRLYGNSWHRLPSKSKLRDKVVSAAIHGAELRTVVTSSLASINLLRRQNAGAHNMRTFEVPAMGGLMLTSRTGEQNELFPDGKAALMFDDPRELRSRVLSLLSSDFDVAALRSEARLRCVGNSYTDRASEILAALRD